MNGLWGQIVKVGGPVGIVAFLFWTSFNTLLESKSLILFGNSQVFTIVLVMISGLLIALIVAILKYPEKKNTSQVLGNKAIFKGRVNVQGDFVQGDKHNSDGKSTK